MTLTTTTLGGETGGLPLLESGVIAVVRAPEADRVRAVARALAAGGVGALNTSTHSSSMLHAQYSLATRFMPSRSGVMSAMSAAR